MTGLLRIYPRWWRERYAAEMAVLLEERPPRPGDGRDLVRGALDAWLRPPDRSPVPAAAALVGGGAWTVGASAVVLAPAPPDWPGYLFEILPLAAIAAVALWVAALGVARRIGDAGGRALTFAVSLATVGHLAWFVALLLAATVGVERAVLAGAQTLAMIGAVAVGTALVRWGDLAVGALVLAAPLALLIPWTGGWLLYGGLWTAVGVTLWFERRVAAGPRRPA